MKLRWCIPVLLLLCAPARADDALELDASRVTGNRELPKVMVIVPWKKAAPGEVPGRPLDSLLDEALAPLGRESFRRELDYYRELGIAEAERVTQEE